MKTTPAEKALAGGDLVRQVEESLRKVPLEWQHTVSEFLEYLAAKGRDESTRLNYLLAIRTLPANGKKLQRFTAKDLMSWASGLDERCKRGEFKPSTVVNWKVCVKQFFKWIYNGTDPNGEYPEIVRWLNAGRRRLGYNKEVLSPEEVKRLVETADNQRDRALIFTAYEGGARASEILGLRLRDVEFDQYGAVIKVSGKTGERRIRLIDSVPDLQLWFNMHPANGNPDAYLWPSRNGEDVPLSRTRFYWIVRKYAAKIGLEKHVGPHTFRHSRATHLAGVLKESQLREFFGWTRDSRMPGVYVHLSGRDIDEALLEHYGIKRSEPKPEERPLAPKRCPRCKNLNPAGAKFCTICSAALDLKTALDLEDSRAQADDLVAKVMQEFIRQAPELLNRIIEERGLKQEIARIASEAP